MGVFFFLSLLSVSTGMMSTIFMMMISQIRRTQPLFQKKNLAYLILLVFFKNLKLDSTYLYVRAFTSSHCYINSNQTLIKFKRKLTFCKKTTMLGILASLACSRAKRVCGERMKIFDLPYFTSFPKPMESMMAFTPSVTWPR